MRKQCLRIREASRTSLSICVDFLDGYWKKGKFSAIIFDRDAPSEFRLKVSSFNWLVEVIDRWVMKVLLLAVVAS